MSKDRITKIVFDPSSSRSNKYINLITENLQNEGYEIIDLKSFFSSLQNIFSIDLIHLNWFEKLETYLGTFKKCIWLIVLLLLRKKIVWTMHNKISHGARFPILTDLIIRVLIKKTTKIIGHCSESAELIRNKYTNTEEKLIIIPHPHYIKAYPELSNDEIAKVNNSLKLLFIGAIKPYKNIELLISVIKEVENVEIIVAGKVNDPNFKDKIEVLSENNDSIHLNLEFIKDDDISKLMNKIDIVVLPYNYESILNSGTCYLSFSFKKPVIAPLFGTTRDIRNKDCCILYSYANDMEHRKVLKESIEMARNIKKRNPSYFCDSGLKLFDEMLDFHNPELVGKKLANVYQNILNS